MRYAFREVLGLAVMGLALFWSAGRLDWWQGWATLAVMAAWIVATAAIVIGRPGLLAERLGPRPGAKRWDLVIMSVMGGLQLARYVVAGLGQRYAWTSDFPTVVEVAALGLCIFGYAVVVWATAVNEFFSQIARIQSDRGQRVISAGPYRVVRHPAYAGAIVYELAVPFLLGSWPAVLLLSCVTAVLLVIRTGLEDRMLHAELAGYPEYARRVQARLVPGLW